MRATPRILSILLLLSPTLALGTPITDPLWIAAVKSAIVTADWVPGDAAFLIQLVDDKGAPQETWQTSYRLTESSAGEVTLDVIRASHNDTDTTQKEQENQKKRKSTPFSMGDNPFDPLVQDGVEARRLHALVLKGGVSCVAFDFSMKKKDATTIAGTAWLDARTGIPVEVSYTSQPLPRGLFKMTMTLRYASGPAGDGFLNEVLVEGVGGFLFIRKNFRSTITLGGYWRRGS